jgi:predicted ATP-grasp superfamily ATP-dependent carboligase
VNAEDHLLLFGASVRATAFAALRAGLRPWCADLFADADLQARCPTLALAPGHYPLGFEPLCHQGPPGPWMYVGGLENRRSLVRRLARLRPLWGNPARVLAVVRSPRTVAKLLHEHGLACPAVRLQPAKTGRWLVKPRAGAGGARIHFWTDQEPATPRPRGVYYQEYVEGEACAASYLGDGRQARFLGMTRQLIGIDWLHAASFHYCGSVGPLEPAPRLRQVLEQLGQVLVQASGLRGLFGVDFIHRDDLPWPVEVNPRYTASVEVLEYARNLPALALHRQVFDPAAPIPPASVSGGDIVGKAILFARAPLVFPEDGPWQPTLTRSGPIEEMPAFADIPQAGQRIAACRPILTFFARAVSEADCLDHLRRIARDLDLWFFGA